MEKAQMVLGILGFCLQKYETKPLPYTLYKNQLKTKQDVTLWPSIKLLEENIGEASKAQAKKKRKKKNGITSS